LCEKTGTVDPVEEEQKGRRLPFRQTLENSSRIHNNKCTEVEIVWKKKTFLLALLFDHEIVHGTATVAYVGVHQANTLVSP